MKAGTTPRVPSAEATASIPVDTLCDLVQQKTEICGATRHVEPVAPDAVTRRRHRMRARPARWNGEPTAYHRIPEGSLYQPPAPIRASPVERHDRNKRRPLHWSPVSMRRLATSARMDKARDFASRALGKMPMGALIRAIDASLNPRRLSSSQRRRWVSSLPSAPI